MLASLGMLSKTFSVIFKNHVSRSSTRNRFFSVFYLFQVTNRMTIRCLKITEKVSFSIATKAKFTFWVDKSSLKSQKWSILGDFLKTLKNETFFGDLQTLWVRYKRRQIGLLKATACFASCSQAKIGPNALLRHPKSLLF